uniref:Trafficking protein particle complex subunit 13 N-terminal domain-containing protein n=1 Tax=Timema bartmani TaxID=61472 RepID=A0A7R9I4B3_9NEOP|nr:unnamed protein product [Timema bartmani]
MTGEGREKNDLLALKVMRLTRPTLSTPLVVTTDSKDLPGNLLNIDLKQDITAVSGAETLTAGQFLLLPQSFGAYENSSFYWLAWRPLSLTFSRANGKLPFLPLDKARQQWRVFNTVVPRSEPVVEWLPNPAILFNPLSSRHRPTAHRDSRCRDFLMFHRDSRCRDFVMFHCYSRCRDLMFHRDSCCRDFMFHRDSRCRDFMFQCDSRCRDILLFHRD